MYRHGGAAARRRKKRKMCLRGLPYCEIFDLRLQLFESSSCQCEEFGKIHERRFDQDLLVVFRFHLDFDRF